MPVSPQADKYRARLRRAKASAAKKKVAPVQGELTGEAQGLAEELAEWCASTLVVPVGHPLAGQPMVLPDYVRLFLEEALLPEVKEALLCTARKNSKTGGIAMFLLGLLVGPLRRPGTRIGTVSITREKAGELLTQTRQIAEASNLGGLDFMKTPAPGMIRGPGETTAEFLSADKSSGHASGFDWSIVDELGLMTERDRPLIAGMRSATSARNGKLLALSIRGESPMLEEMIERRDLPQTAVHLHSPPEGDVDIHDPQVWALGNPGLAIGIKSMDYMAAEAARVTATPSDLSSFLAYDLNLPQSPTREMICAPEDLKACWVEELPPRAGTAWIGLDFGGAQSGSSAFVVWPQTGRCEMRLAFGDVPDLLARGREDGARYDIMADRGEVQTYPGRVTPVNSFLRDLADDLAGVHVGMLASDSYKDAELRTFLEQAGLRWPYEFRRVGAGKDGGRDVRATQRLILNKRLKMKENLALATAISNSAIHRDANGNPGLDKQTSRGRIDLLSAMVIACGLAEEHFDRPVRRLWRNRGLV